jgi:hypothetical protein
MQRGSRFPNGLAVQAHLDQEGLEPKSFEPVGRGSWAHFTHWAKVLDPFGSLVWRARLALLNPTAATVIHEVVPTRNLSLSLYIYIIVYKYQ